MSKSYSFPMVKPREIVSCLGMLGLDVSLEQLKKIDETPALFKSILSQLANHIFNEEREDRVTKFRALDEFEFEELHEDSVPQVHVITDVLRLMRAAGIHDASMRDFVAPTYQRAKRVLSGLINLAKFREDLGEEYGKYLEHSNGLLEAKHELEQQKARLEVMLEDLQAQRAEEQPEKEELEAENSALDRKIHALNHQHAELVERTRRMKHELKELTDSIASTKFTVLEAKQENTRLRSQIVKSPEKLRAKISSMGDTTEATKEEVAEAKTKLRTLQARCDALDRASEKITKRTINLDDCREDVTRARAIVEEVAQKTREVANLESRIRETGDAEQHLRKQISTAQDKLFRLQRKYEQKRHAAQLALDQVQHEKLALSRNNARDKAQVEKNEARQTALRRELDTLRRDHQDKTAAVRARLAKLESLLHRFHDSLNQAMREPVRQPIRG